MISNVKIRTKSKQELVDITSQTEDIVSKSSVQEGIALIFAKHTTCAVIICELEDQLEKDFLNYLEKEGPKGPFGHSHGDLLAHDPKHARKSHTPAHLLSAIVGQSVSVPIGKNQMQLGTWQRICLLELDGPRERELLIQIIS